MKKTIPLVSSFFAQYSSQIIVGKVKVEFLSGNRRVIYIPYFLVGSIPSGFSAQLNALGIAITQFFSECNSSKKSMTDLKKDLRCSGFKIEVRIISLQHPYLDSTIFSQYVALNACKYPFARIHKHLFKKGSFLDSTVQVNKKRNKDEQNQMMRGSLTCSNVNSVGYITGIKMELAGRLTTQRSIPRKTVSNKHRGSFPASNGNLSILRKTKLNQYASKNKIGAYTMKI